MHSLSLGVSLVSSRGGEAGIPVGTWILAVNTWDDTGIWLDTETWND